MARDFVKLWQDVTSDPEYAALPAEQQAALKQRYYQKFIKPQGPEVGQQFVLADQPQLAEQAPAETTLGGAFGEGFKQSLVGTAGRALGLVSPMEQETVSIRPEDVLKEALGRTAGQVLPDILLGGVTSKIAAKAAAPLVTGATERLLAAGLSRPVAQAAAATIPAGLEGAVTGAVQPIIDPEVAMQDKLREAAIQGGLGTLLGVLPAYPGALAETKAMTKAPGALPAAAPVAMAGETVAAPAVPAEPVAPVRPAFPEPVPAAPSLAPMSRTRAEAEAVVKSAEARLNKANETMGSLQEKLQAVEEGPGAARLRTQYQTAMRALRQQQQQAILDLQDARAQLDLLPVRTAGKAGKDILRAEAEQARQAEALGLTPRPPAPRPEPPAPPSSEFPEFPSPYKTYRDEQGDVEELDRLIRVHGLKVADDLQRSNRIDAETAKQLEYLSNKAASAAGSMQKLESLYAEVESNTKLSNEERSRLSRQYESDYKAQQQKFEKHKEEFTRIVDSATVKPPERVIQPDTTTTGVVPVGQAERTPKAEALAAVQSTAAQASAKNAPKDTLGLLKSLIDTARQRGATQDEIDLVLRRGRRDAREYEGLTGQVKQAKPAPSEPTPLSEGLVPVGTAVPTEPTEWQGLLLDQAKAVLADPTNKAELQTFADYLAGARDANVTFRIVKDGKTKEISVDQFAKEVERKRKLGEAGVTKMGERPTAPRPPSRKPEDFVPPEQPKTLESFSLGETETPTKTATRKTQDALERSVIDDLRKAELLPDEVAKPLIDEVVALPSFEKVPYGQAKDLHESVATAMTDVAGSVPRGAGGAEMRGVIPQAMRRLSVAATQQLPKIGKLLDRMVKEGTLTKEEAIQTMRSILIRQEQLSGYVDSLNQYGAEILSTFKNLPESLVQKFMQFGLTESQARRVSGLEQALVDIRNGVDPRSTDFYKTAQALAQTENVSVFPVPDREIPILTTQKPSRVVERPELTEGHKTFMREELTRGPINHEAESIFNRRHNIIGKGKNSSRKPVKRIHPKETYEEGKAREIRDIVKKLFETHLTDVGRVLKNTDTPLPEAMDLIRNDSAFGSANEDELVAFFRNQYNMNTERAEELAKAYFQPSPYTADTVDVKAGQVPDAVFKEQTENRSELGLSDKVDILADTPKDPPKKQKTKRVVTRDENGDPVVINNLCPPEG